MEEASKHPHNVARETFIEIEGVTQPAPAPRFSRTVSEIQGPSALSGEHTEEILKELGLDEDAVLDLKIKGIVA
jgi:alpha-methylacyl-CoA racemase